MTAPVEIFYSYSHKDAELRGKLENHLSILKRQEVISSWYDRKIDAGDEWRGQIDIHLKSARIILLLVSADFLASDYCYDVELRESLKRHESGDARVIPIILRAVDWKSAPFGRLQALPKDGKPITSWRNRDEAFKNVAEGIRGAVEGMLPSPSPLATDKRRRWVMVLNATFDEMDNKKVASIIAQLNKISGDYSITLKNIETGSVLMSFESSERAFEITSTRYETANQNRIVGIEVEDVVAIPNLAEVHGIIGRETVSTFKDYQKFLGQLGFYLRVTPANQLDDNYVLAIERLLNEIRNSSFLGVPTKLHDTLQDAMQLLADLASVIKRDPVGIHGPRFANIAYELGLLLVFLSQSDILKPGIEFFSCFISHSAKDKQFCEHLYTDLQANGVRAWYFPEDAKWGEPVWGEIDRSIKVFDKLIVVCSKNSLTSGPVLREIERALNRESKEGKNFLFPMTIDNYFFEQWEHPRKADVLAKVVGDFRGWNRSAAKYDAAFKKLLKALKAN